MATTNKKANKKTETKTYVEFEFEGENFTYTGRAYPEYATDTAKCTITPVSLTINGLITVKGVKLFATKKNTWLKFPEYKSGDEYKSFFYLDEDMNDDLSELAGTIQAALSA